MSIDGETLERWRRATEAALTGPWVHVDGQVASVREDGVAMFIEATGGPTDPEAAFIALAREAMPRLLAELRAARDMLKEHEFCCASDWDDQGYRCPECGGSDPKGHTLENAEHEPDCKLAALIGGHEISTGRSDASTEVL